MFTERDPVRHRGDEELALPRDPALRQPEPRDRHRRRDAQTGVARAPGAELRRQAGAVEGAGVRHRVWRRGEPAVALRPQPGQMDRVCQD